MVESINEVLIDSSKNLTGKVYFVLEFFGRNHRSNDWVVNIEVYDSPEVELGKSIKQEVLNISDSQVMSMFGGNTINTLASASASGLLIVPLIDANSDRFWGLKTANLKVN